MVELGGLLKKNLNQEAAIFTHSSIARAYMMSF